MQNSAHVKYLTVSQTDLKWGLAVNSVGRQEIAPFEPYPPKDHPSRYLFSFERGRKLEEFQLIYLIKGEGEFMSETLGHGHRVAVKAGDMLVLFPQEWHTYRPLPEVGWSEQWIGFQGEFPDSLENNGFLSKDRPVLHVGIHSEMVELYNRAIEIATAQLSGFQQALHGIASNLISLSYYYDKNFQFNGNFIPDSMNKAKIAISENLVTITPEDAAKAAGMGYSNFRKLFREYTGFSPGQYIQEVKLSKARELLTNTSMNIKEIAYSMGYENDYFFTAFRRRFGVTPMEYRNKTQGKNL